jgi:hypothetical protein
VAGADQHGYQEALLQSYTRRRHEIVRRDEIGAQITDGPESSAVARWFSVWPRAM